MDRRYSTLMVLAIAALFAEACSSGNGNGGTGGAGGASSMGGAGGAGTGGRAGATGSGGATNMGGMTGAGGRTDGGVDMSTSVGGMTGGPDASDAPKDMSVATDTPVSTDTGTTTDTGGGLIDTSVDGDPAATEKALCKTAPFMANVTTTPFTAVQFCTLYRELCNELQGVTNFATEAACEAAYNGYNMTPNVDNSPSGQQGCRSYHLCNAYNLALNPHCAHATGLSAFDGGVGAPCP